MGIQVFSKRAHKNNLISGADRSQPKKNKTERNVEELSSATNTIQELGVEEWVITQLKNMAIFKPTVVQIKSIPVILHGQDVVVSSKTGDGKTLSYTIPILQELFKDPYGIFGLILVPIRELAFQIADQFNAIGSTSRVRTAIITGGKDIVSNHDALKKRPHIVVATPGRLVDLLHYNQDLVKYFMKLRFFVLDEADRLIESSYEQELTYLFKLFTREEINAQKLLFSATLTKELLSLCMNNDKNTQETSPVKYNGYLSLKNPYIYHSGEYQIPSQMIQEGILIPSHVKIGYLFYMLTDLYSDLRSIIVFVGKYFTCEMLYITGKQLKLPVVRLHSKMKQRSRIESLVQFKNEKGKILITTDVASRGLDIPSVQLVINYDLPYNPLEYIHRVGRTARGNKLGKSLSFVMESDLKRLEAIQDLISIELPFITVDETPILQTLPNILKKKRIAIMEMHGAGIDIKDEM